MKRFRAIYLTESCIRKVTFEAPCLDEARRLAAGWGFGLEGEEAEELPQFQSSSFAPEAFDVANACRILGDISRTTLYRLLLRGQLERLPATRKVLVTRRSVERFCSRGP
jgi:hypothetical protein